MSESNVYSTMLEDPICYSEFLACYNNIISSVIDIYLDRLNFAFCVVNKMSRSGIYIKTESREFMDRAIREFNQKNSIVFVIAKGLCEDLSCDGWNRRHQFFADTEFKALTIPTVQYRLYKAGKEDAERVDAIGDNRLSDKYRLGIDYEDMKIETWLLDAGGVPVSGCILNEYGPDELSYGMKEIMWIYTKDECREKGYGKMLLAELCAFCARQNVRVTYHCDYTNFASYATAHSVGLRQICDIRYKEFMS